MTQQNKKFITAYSRGCDAKKVFIYAKDIEEAMYRFEQNFKGATLISMIDEDDEREEMKMTPENFEENIQNSLIELEVRTLLDYVGSLKNSDENRNILDKLTKLYYTVTSGYSLEKEYEVRRHHMDILRSRFPQYVRKMWSGSDVMVALDHIIVLMTGGYEDDEFSHEELQDDSTPPIYKS